MALSQYLAYTDYTCADGPADIFDNRHPDDGYRFKELRT